MAALASAWRADWRTAGAAIAVVGRNEAKSAAAVAELRARGVRAIAVTADVTDKAAVAAMVERTVRELGRIDILVNNAGINIRKPPQALELEEWDSVITTNLTSAFLCSQAVYPAMKAGGRRQDHQHRLDDVDLRRQLRAGLCREQGRHRAVHALLRGRLGRRQHPGQRGAAGLDRHRPDQARPRADRRPARQGAGAHAGGAMGRDRPTSPASRCFSPPARRTSSPAPRFPSMADFRSWARSGVGLRKKSPGRCRSSSVSSLGRTSTLGEKQIPRDPYLTDDSPPDSSSTGGRVLSERPLLSPFCRDQLHNRNKNRQRATAKYAWTLSSARLRSLHPAPPISRPGFDG